MSGESGGAVFAQTPQPNIPVAACTARATALPAGLQVCERGAGLGGLDLPLRPGPGCSPPTATLMEEGLFSTPALLNNARLHGPGLCSTNKTHFYYINKEHVPESVRPVITDTWIPFPILAKM